MIFSLLLNEFFPPTQKLFLFFLSKKPPLPSSFFFRKIYFFRKNIFFQPKQISFSKKQISSSFSYMFSLFFVLPTISAGATLFYHIPSAAPFSSLSSAPLTACGTPLQKVPPRVKVLLQLQKARLIPYGH